MLDLRSHPAPLLPVTHAHAPSDPVIQFGHWPVILADAKVSRPTPQILPQFAQPVFRADSPTAPREFFDPVLEVRQGLFSPTNFLAPDRETQKAAFAHQCHLAFGRVDLELEGRFQVPRD